MNIRILQSATEDLKEGFSFYENQEAGLGTYFLESLFADIESLERYAGSHGVHFEKYHRLLSKHFPFAVYYRVVNDYADVYAVVDCRRKPAWIKRKFK